MSREKNLHQTYLKDCGCNNGGIIIYEGEAVCRWCRKPYATGGSIYYLPEHFKQSHTDKLREVNIYFDKQVLNPYPMGSPSYTAWEKGYLDAASKYYAAFPSQSKPAQEDKPIEDKIPEWIPKFVHQMVKDAFAKEIMEAESKAFYAAREWAKGEWSNQFFPNGKTSQFEYPTFSDYKQKQQSK